MARGAKGPDEQIKALEAERLRIAVEKDEAARAVRDAREILGNDGPRSSANRQRAALQAQARGRDHELLETIAKDASNAQAAVVANRVKVEALDRAIKEVAAEVAGVEDQHLRHFVQAANAASLEALEVRETARQALTAAFEAWRQADGAWGRVRAARRRLDWPPLPACPLTDLNSVVSGFESALRQMPWPGGKRPERDAQIEVAWTAVDYPVRWDGVRTTEEEPLL